MTLKTRAEIIKEIVAFRNNGGSKISWDKVAKHFGVSKPCIYRLVKEDGYSPGVHNSMKLGMKHEVKVEVCPTHGIVHCYDCETEQVKPRRNGTAPARKRTPPIRIGEATDEQLAAVMALSPAERLEKLLE